MTTSSKSVLKALHEFHSGKLGLRELLRAIIEFTDWNIPVNDELHASLWTIENTDCLAAMLEEKSPNNKPSKFLKMRGTHLAKHIPADAGAIIFEMGKKHQVRIERGKFAEFEKNARAYDVDLVLDNPQPDQVSLLLDHVYLVLCGNGKPRIISHRKTDSILIFTDLIDLGNYLNHNHDLGNFELQYPRGSDLFSELAKREDYDAVYINPHREPEWRPLAPGEIFLLSEGNEPRPEAAILKARCVAEIYEFLGNCGYYRESLKHEMEYCGDTLVAAYTVELTGRGIQTYRFFPCEEPGSKSDFGPGKSDILCSGLQAYALRLRREDDDEEQIARYLRIVTDLKKLVEPGSTKIPRHTIRTVSGALFIMTFPELATLEYLEKNEKELQSASKV